MTSKRSKHELKRLIEDAVVTVCRPKYGLWFAVDDVEVCGRPPERLRVWYTLHFHEKQSPFCCGEPGCHLWPFEERLAEIGNNVRRSMNLRQRVEVEFVGANSLYHQGVTFAH